MALSIHSLAWYVDHFTYLRFNNRFSSEMWCNFIILPVELNQSNKKKIIYSKLELNEQLVIPISSFRIATQRKSNKNKATSIKQTYYESCSVTTCCYFFSSNLCRDFRKLCKPIYSVQKKLDQTKQTKNNSLKFCGLYFFGHRTTFLHIHAFRSSMHVH